MMMPRILIVSLLSFVGIGISIQSINHHEDVKGFGTTDAYCNINDSLNCDKVAQSDFSELFGLPLGVWGLAFFTLMTALSILILAKRKESLRPLLTFGYLIGCLVSVALFLISTFLVESFCLTCIFIYSVCFVSTAVSTNGQKIKDWLTPNKSWIFLGAVQILVLAIMGGVYTANIPAEEEKMAFTDLVPKLSKTKQEIPIFSSNFAEFGKDHQLGDASAVVTIVEFADFQCPACRSVAMLMRQVKQEFPDQVRVVFKNFPLDITCNKTLQRQIHPMACYAATLARCAGQNGKFWEFHDLLFRSQESLSLESMKAQANGFGISNAQIDNCLQSTFFINKLDQDIRLANELGVSATPTLFIDGRKYLGDRSKLISFLRTYIDKKRL